MKSMEEATGGSLERLAASLRRYRKLQTIQFDNPGLVPKMTVTVLPRSADDLLLDSVRLVLSPTGRVDAGFLNGVRRKAARYPGDRFAEQTLARAEFVMGDVAAGEAIMKRRLEAQANDLEDLLLAGAGQLMAGMRDRAVQEARYRAARPLLGKAYGLDKNDFRTLYAYALSRSIEPKYPNDNDLAALREAHYLAPSVQEITFRYGTGLLQKGQRADAVRMLTPLINDPHGGEMAAQVRTMLEQGGVGSPPDADSSQDAAKSPQPSGQPSAPAN